MYRDLSALTHPPLFYLFIFNLRSSQYYGLSPELGENDQLGLRKLLVLLLICMMYSIDLCTGNLEVRAYIDKYKLF